MATREEALIEFSKVMANAVAEALRANPPVAAIPEPIAQALMQLVAKANAPQPPVQQVPVPVQINPFQMQLPQAPSHPAIHRVLRYNERGEAMYVDVSVPQLLAEMCDLLMSQNQFLEMMVNGTGRGRKKVG